MRGAALFAAHRLDTSSPNFFVNIMNSMPIYSYANNLFFIQQAIHVWLFLLANTFCLMALAWRARWSSANIPAQPMLSPSRHMEHVQQEFMTKKQFAQHFMKKNEHMFNDNTIHVDETISDAKTNKINSSRRESDDTNIQPSIKIGNHSTAQVFSCATTSDTPPTVQKHRSFVLSQQNLKQHSNVLDVLARHHGKTDCQYFSPKNGGRNDVEMFAGKRSLEKKLSKPRISWGTLRWPETENNANTLPNNMPGASSRSRSAEESSQCGSSIAGIRSVRNQVEKKKVIAI